LWGRARDRFGRTLLSLKCYDIIAQPLQFGGGFLAALMEQVEWLARFSEVE
jgi:hypothetical protein